MPRLNSVLKELNIGFETASLFLKSEFGFDLQSVNDKITEEQEASLVSNFQHDKIQYSVIRKKFASKKNRKNQNPEIPDLDEYEQEVWDTLNEPLKKTHKAKRQARRGSRPVKERTIYVIKKKPQVISVPFGGQTKK